LYGSMVPEERRMGTKTTLVIDPALFKAAKRVAVEREVTLSSIMNKGLLLYVSDPESVEEMAEILSDRRAMAALLEGMEARAKGRKGYYLEWNKLRDI